MKIDINHKDTNQTILSRECVGNTGKITLEKAIEAKVKLRGADLEGEILTKTPLQILNLPCPVLISDTYMRIGCQRFLIEQWRGFSDDEIQNMECGTSSFWKTWKAPLLAMCDAHNHKDV